MEKIAIIYGSSTGTTAAVADQIASALSLNSQNVFDIAKFSIDQLPNFDMLILGTSTWGYGDLQDDWEAALPSLEAADLTGKRVALFGCGDSSSYEETFCNGMGTIYQALKGSGCKFIGAVSTDGYDFSDSSAVENGQFVGLPIDNDNQEELTKERIANWIKTLV